MNSRSRSGPSRFAFRSLLRLDTPGSRYAAFCIFVAIVFITGGGSRGDIHTSREVVGLTHKGEVREGTEAALLKNFALTGQIGDVIADTKFNGVALFDGTAGTLGAVSIQIGANAGEIVTLNFAAIVDATTATTVVTQADANIAIATVDTFLATINTNRAGLGAGQSRLESAVNNLTNNVTNLADARSRVEDTDYSTETTALAKAQILSQASTAMLSQANQSQQNVLSLLR